MGLLFKASDNIYHSYKDLLHHMQKHITSVSIFEKEIKSLKTDDIEMQMFNELIFGEHVADMDKQFKEGIAKFDDLINKLGIAGHHLFGEEANEEDMELGELFRLGNSQCESMVGYAMKK